MFRSLLIIAALTVSQIGNTAFAGPQKINKSAGAVETLDAGRADHTLFVKLVNDPREFRVVDTNNQSAEVEATIKALNKSYNSTLDGVNLPVEVTFNQDLVISAAKVK